MRLGLKFAIHLFPEKLLSQIYTESTALLSNHIKPWNKESIDSDQSGNSELFMILQNNGLTPRLTVFFHTYDFFLVLDSNLLYIHFQYFMPSFGYQVKKNPY